MAAKNIPCERALSHSRRLLHFRHKNLTLRGSAPQCDAGNEDESAAVQGAGANETLATQVGNLPSQLGRVADVAISQEEATEGVNRPSCRIGDLQKITTVELLMGS